MPSYRHEQEIKFTQARLQRLDEMIFSRECEIDRYLTFRDKLLRIPKVQLREYLDQVYETHILEAEMIALLLYHKTANQNVRGHIGFCMRIEAPASSFSRKYHTVDRRLPEHELTDCRVADYNFFLKAAASELHHIVRSSATGDWVSGRVAPLEHRKESLKREMDEVKRELDKLTNQVITMSPSEKAIDMIVTLYHNRRDNLIRHLEQLLELTPKNKISNWRDALEEQYNYLLSSDSFVDFKVLKKIICNAPSYIGTARAQVALDFVREYDIVSDYHDSLVNTLAFYQEKLLQPRYYDVTYSGKVLTQEEQLKHNLDREMDLIVLSKACKHHVEHHHPITEIINAALPELKFYAARYASQSSVYKAAKGKAAKELIVLLNDIAKLLTLYPNIDAQAVLALQVKFAPLRQTLIDAVRAANESSCTLFGEKGGGHILKMIDDKKGIGALPDKLDRLMQDNAKRQQLLRRSASGLDLHVDLVDEQASVAPVPGKK